MPRSRLLVCVDWFDPGSRAGGPIRSCVNLVDLLCHDARITVLTGSRDLGETRNYADVKVSSWNNWKSRAAVWYATHTQHFSGAFCFAVRRLRPETIYLNSMFSTTGAVIPMLMQWMLPKTRLIIAPRGMLKPSALAHRRWKKSAWLTFLRWTKTQRRIVFHATSDEEAAEVRAVFGASTRVCVVPNIPCVPADTIWWNDKIPGNLRLSLVGRVHPIKNILFAIRLLKNVSYSCSLDIVGPAEDPIYNSECQREIDSLPQNVKVTFLGSVSNAAAIQVVQRSHAMILPTLGENFGHSIFEAMAIGIPVIISDQTYWRGLETDGAGWDLPLSDEERFSLVLERLAAMENPAYHGLQHGAHQRAIQFFKDNNLKQDYMEMFFGKWP